MVSAMASVYHIKFFVSFAITTLELGTDQVLS